MSAEERFEVARRTGEMVALVERLLEGRASRDELRAWAHAQGNRYSRPDPFRGNVAADALHACLWDLDAVLAGGEPLVRDVDLAEHLRLVREGDYSVPPAEVAFVRLTVAEVAHRANALDPPTRESVEGLGWYEFVRFASPATGRRFFANAPFEPRPPAPFGREASLVYTDGPAKTPEEHALVLEDLLDALYIDHDDLVAGPGGGALPSPRERWALMRVDDHGNAYRVATFSGYAKARARLAEFEARSHKQSYWLERANPAPG